MNYKARVDRLEQQFGHGALFDRDVVTYMTRPGDDEKAAQRKAIQEFEAEHAREIGQDALFICYRVRGTELN